MKTASKRPYLQIGVRTLVEFTRRSGDLDMGFQRPASALEGIRAHQKIQNSRPEGYCPEVAVSRQVETSRFILDISGRIDGVWSDSKKTTIEEIKSTGRDLEALKPEGHDLHWSQLKVYAWLYADQQGLSEVEGLLTYCRQGTGEILELRKTLLWEEINAFAAGLVEQYLVWAERMYDWRQMRDRSIRKLDFPYPAYRPGQRDMAVSVYRTVLNGGSLMIQAATGIGKTLAALFPVLKAMAEGRAEKCFYLTARTTGRAAAEAAFQKMREGGLRFRALTLTAKDKLCFLPEAACLPTECAFARGHYDRLNGALSAAMEAEALTRRVVEALARRFQVCPFEFSLELALWADGIICDYNYAFDPRVHLRRFFQDSSDPYIFLVDEAHNLVDRSREMFSAELTKQPILDVRRSIRKELPQLHRALGRVNRWMVDTRKSTEAMGGQQSDCQAPDGLIPLLRSASLDAERWLVKNEMPAWREALIDLYFSITNFLRTYESYGSAYATCYETDGRDLRTKLFCVDPSDQLREALNRARTVVFFSATLMPPSYFLDIFGCDPTTPVLRVPSPYATCQLRLLVDGRTSTYFKERRSTCRTVAESIRAMVGGRKGNYLCFFPSYEYMEMVHEVFHSTYTRLETLVQSRAMGEGEREAYLERFDRDNPDTLIGFAVMGGVFGEGIDLVGDRLSGAVVVGVGLPGLSPERELIRKYYAEKLAAGFEYAYQYPGMNRVLQAAGRVIRSGEDRGVVLLVDRRYRTPPYRKLFPEEWNPVMAANPASIARVVSTFWRQT